MNQTTTSSTLPLPSLSSSSPCSTHEVAISPGDCVESGMEEWFEDEAVAGFRVWQLAGIILSILLSIIIGLCCCIRFRVPRTKQEIEADYIRKKITKHFRKKLSKISNTDMNDMDLQKALEKIRSEINQETNMLDKNSTETTRNKRECVPRKKLSAVFTGIRDRFSRLKHSELSDTI